MAITYLDAVNTLLKRTREDQVSSVSDNDYSILLGEYVNLAKDVLETRYDWSRLRITKRILTSVGVWAYEIDELGVNYKIEKVFNDSQDYELYYRPYVQMSQWLNANDAEDIPGPPAYYDINGTVNTPGGADDPVINLYPIPDTRDYINIDAVVAQVPLSADTDEIIVPSQPLIEQALVYVLEERGEDDGIRYEKQLQRAEEMAIRYMTLDLHKWEEESLWRIK